MVLYHTHTRLNSVDTGPMKVQIEFSPVKAPFGAFLVSIFPLEVKPRK